jgi:hypothetical protein
MRKIQKNPPKKKNSCNLTVKCRGKWESGRGVLGNGAVNSCKGPGNREAWEGKLEGRIPGVLGGGGGGFREREGITQALTCAGGGRGRGSTYFKGWW